MQVRKQKIMGNYTLKPDETRIIVKKDSAQKLNILKAQHGLESQKETLKKLLNGELETQKQNESS